MAICQAEKIVPRSDGDDKIKENTAKNLKRYCGLIDFCCGGFLVGKPGFSLSGQVKLVTFGEYAITGRVHPAQPDQKDLTREEAKKYLAISIPGEETDMLPAKIVSFGDTHSVYGKGGLSIPSSLSASSRNFLRDDVICRRSSSDREGIILLRYSLLSTCL